MSCQQTVSFVQITSFNLICVFIQVNYSFIWGKHIFMQFGEKELGTPTPAHVSSTPDSDPVCL